MTSLLGPTQIRDLARRLGVHPAKARGQNFVVDAGTIRRIVRIAGVRPGEQVVEVGPGLGSLTLGLLEAGADVVAVEIDPVLARQLSATVAELAPQWAAQLVVLEADALTVSDLGARPTALVANLPYNIAVPVLLGLLARVESLERAVVMVQAEVADRLVAPPGSRTYGVPSAKVAWYAQARRAGSVGRAVFWPVPRVDSALVRLERRDPPRTTATRQQTFSVIDVAFAQRRKTLRAALARFAGSAQAAERVLREAGIDPSARGERLGIADFARIAERLDGAGPLPPPRR